MADMVLPSHETLLKLCAGAGPEPWYPKRYVEESGIARADLDGLLNELRLAGLLRLSDWQKSRGQGYVLTPLGEETLKNPDSLTQSPNGALKPSGQHRVSAPEPRVEAPSSYDIAEAARRAIYEPTPPRVAPALLVLNLIMFGVSLFTTYRLGQPVGQFLQSGNAAVMHELGACRASDLVHGQWWRLLTCGFLHFGLLHLVLNMYSLYALGVLESLFGWWRYLIIYLAAGIGGSCVAMFWNPSDKAVLAGASCSIWGLLTSLVAWLFINRSYLNPAHVSAWFRSIGIVFLINIFVSMLPGISAAGHFGGGIVGFVVSSLLLVERYAPRPRRTVAIILLLLLPVIGYEAAAYSMENDPRWQRVRQQDALQSRLQAVERFQRDVVPAVDRAEKAFIDLETVAYGFTDTPPEDRNMDRRRHKLMVDLQAAAQRVKSALTKLDENPDDDERLEAARTAGRAYMQRIAEQIGRFEKLINLGLPWDDKLRRGTPLALKKAQETWIDTRNHL